MHIFTDLFSAVILFFYQFFGNNLGLAIIAFTFVVRLIILPLTLPSIKSTKKIRELQPELKKLKQQYKNDQQGYALAQAQFFKSYNINPLAGCLPQLLQFVILIFLYQAIISMFSGKHGDLNFSFFWLNLSQPDHLYIAPILAGITQFFLSLMLSPATQTRDIIPNDSKNKTVQQENKKEEDVAEMAAMMQQQMIFMMPLMTTFVGLRLPSGLALYWIVGTVFSLVTQYFLSGWGGIAVYWNRYFASKGLFKGKYLKDITKKDTNLVAKKTEITKKSLFTSSINQHETENLAAVLQTLGGNTQQLSTKSSTPKTSYKSNKKLRQQSKKARKQKAKQRKK